MAVRLPIVMPVEYRGVQAGGEFTNDKGELVVYAPKLKFEYEDNDGDVALVPVGEGQLDKCSPPFNHADLKKGDHVVLHGFVVLQDRNSDRDSYFSVTRVEKANAASLRAAS